MLTYVYVCYVNVSSGVAVKKFVKIVPFLIALMLLTVCAVLHDIPVRDVAHRYIPMAESFAEGNFAFAFHPRVPPLHTTIAGTVAFLTGVDGFTACKIASSLWFLAGIFLIYQLVLHVTSNDRRIAWWSALIYSIFPYSVQMASYGLRESLKSFIFLLAALSLVRIKDDSKNFVHYILLGIAGAFAVMNRTDMVLLAALFILSSAFFECRQSKVPLLSALSGAVMTALSLPAVCIHYRLFKMAMPDFRFAILFKKITGRFPDIPEYLATAAAALVVLLVLGWVLEKVSRKVSVRYLVPLTLLFTAAVVSRFIIVHHTPWAVVKSFLNSLAEGYYTVAGAFIVLYILWRLRYRKLNTFEVLLLTLVFANTVFNILAIIWNQNMLYVSSRYLHPAMPLLFCFFVCGVRDVYEFICRHLPLRLANALLVLAVTGIAGAMLAHLFQTPLRDRVKNRSIMQRKKVHTLAAMIRQDFKSDSADFPLKTDIRHYVGAKRPRLYCTAGNKISVAAYFAGGSLVFEPENADYIAICDQEKIPANSVQIGTIRAHKRIFKVWRVNR